MKPLGAGKYDVRVMAFVNAYWRTKFRPPSVREIMRACDIGSSSVTIYTLKRFAKSGQYIFVGKDARGIVPVWVKEAIEACKRV